MNRVIDTRKRQTLAIYIVSATFFGTVASGSYTPTTPSLPLAAALLALFYLVWQNTVLRHIFAAGFAFGFAFFLAGLWWVFFALSGHIGLPVVGALPLTVLLCLVLALFPALAVTAAAVLAPAGSAGRLFALAGCLTVAEWLRSWVFTGFPWLMPGYSQIPDGWLAGWAPLAGVLGVTLVLTLMLACLLLLFIRTPRCRIGALVILALLFIMPPAINGAWRWVVPSGSISVSLLQGNVPQSLKWEEAVVRQALADYQQMAAAADGQIIIMPETALPLLLEDLPEGYEETLRAIADKRLGSVVAGVFLQDEGGIYNAAVALEKHTAVNYRKIHLTPYGEYLPFADILQPLLGAADIPYPDLAAGSHAVPLLLADGLRTGISICYEAIFGNEWRHQLPEAAFLTNITNDAWFDNTIMPYQHMQMAQARALEMGRWLVRAANTGITAVVNEKGRIVAQLPRRVRGTLTQEITLYRGATPYVLLGDSLAVLCALLLAAAAPAQRFFRVGRLWQQRRQRQKR